MSDNYKLYVEEEEIEDDEKTGSNEEESEDGNQVNSVESRVQYPTDEKPVIDVQGLKSQKKMKRQ